MSRDDKSKRPHRSRHADRPETPVDRLLDQRLIICLGSGGVGKTTVAAALALAASLRRQKGNTAVITVDPARRLKDALGLDHLSTEPRRVASRGAGAHLDALALDTKRTFDALIERVSPTPEIAAQIQANRLYQELSNELGGSTEYMAMEKLHQLMHQEIYRTVVVDTPPSSHARDLLSAPLRMSALLASSAVRILKTPSSLLWGTQNRLANLTISALLRGLERWSGLTLLRDLSDFAGSFEHLAEGFRQRATDVDGALRGAGTSFVLVTTPEPDTITATIRLHQELCRDGFPVAGAIVNQVHQFPPLEEKKLRHAYPNALLQKLLRNYDDYAALTVRDQIAQSRLTAATEGEIPVLAVLPALEQPPSSLKDLARFAGLLTAY